MEKLFSLYENPKNPVASNSIRISLAIPQKLPYFEGYFVVEPIDSPLKKGQLFTETKYRKEIEKQGAGSFKAEMGAEAVRKLLLDIDVEGDAQRLRVEMREATSEAKRKKI